MPPRIACNELVAHTSSTNISAVARLPNSFHTTDSGTSSRLPSMCLRNRTMRPWLVPTTMPQSLLSDSPSAPELLSQRLSIDAEITSSRPFGAPVRNHFVDTFQASPLCAAPLPTDACNSTPLGNSFLGSEGISVDPRKSSQTATRAPPSWSTKALHGGLFGTEPMYTSSKISCCSHSTTMSRRDWPSMGRHDGVGVTLARREPVSVYSRVPEYIWNSSVKAKCRPVESHDSPQGWKFSLGQSTGTCAKGSRCSSSLGLKSR
mmetsp:Transcript_47560/g.133909  ORF Transcript_47560/g.133909 Transcript_47560/m.133909 type:complete len:262 (+) Transcript_47560:444-1229(+)